MQFDPLAMQVQAEHIGLVQPIFVAIVHAFIALGTAVVESSVQIPAWYVCAEPWHTIVHVQS